MMELFNNKLKYQLFRSLKFNTQIINLLFMNSNIAINPYFLCSSIKSVSWRALM